MAIMEAMFYSLPVVTSNVRGNRDLIDDSLGTMEGSKLQNKLSGVAEQK